MLSFNLYTTRLVEIIILTLQFQIALLLDSLVRIREDKFFSQLRRPGPPRFVRYFAFEHAEFNGTYVGVC